MEWRDEGVVLSVKRHGETSAIVELFTAEHGRHAGLVRGGTSRRLKPVLQPGNSVSVVWRARLPDHLGNFTLDIDRGRAGVLMDDPLSLAGLSGACAIVSALPEREVHHALYDAFVVLLDALEHPEIWPAVFVRFELGLLQELGFGLDLFSCAVTGGTEDLIYVSPRTGRAVSGDAGAEYKDRLYRLPQFLIGGRVTEATLEDVMNGFELTGHFLERHLFGPFHGRLPDARFRLMERVAKNTQMIAGG
ncbi:MAG: DNA repair protein RecO [Rhodobiaceae bacterium]|nr:MAG: DNA repair protein RecO [Rhodobiaceae bacterium]